MLAEVQATHVLKIEKVFFALQRPQNPEDYEEEGAPTLRVNPPSSTNSSTLLIIGKSKVKKQRAIGHNMKTRPNRYVIHYCYHYCAGIILVVILAIILLIIIVIKIRAKDSAILKV